VCSIKYIDLQINHFWGNRTAAIATVIMTTITRQYNKSNSTDFSGTVLYVGYVRWIVAWDGGYN